MPKYGPAKSAIVPTFDIRASPFPWSFRHSSFVIPLTPPTHPRRLRLHFPHDPAPRPAGPLADRPPVGVPGRPARVLHALRPDVRGRGPPSDRAVPDPAAERPGPDRAGA